jgi:hypothetical protein
MSASNDSQGRNTVATQNPYAPPNANVLDDQGIADIDNLDVSDSWKRRFRAIHRAGGPKLPNLKDLPRDDRKELGSFSILAFLFGPFYYFAKGMWKKGITLFVLSIIGILLLDMLLELIGLGKFTRATGFGAAAVYAALASRDYYKKMVLGQNGWW